MVVNLVINYRDKSGKRKKIVIPIPDDVYELIEKVKRETGLSEQTIFEIALREGYETFKKEKKLKEYWEKVLCG
jgi:hypothetical protein